MIPPAAVKPAAKSRPIRKPSRSSVPPITVPIPAVASSEATRATALLTPDAMPAFASSASARIAAVSGAVVIDRPTAKTTTPGTTSAISDGRSPTMATRSSTPAAQISGPTPMKRRGPYLSASAPNRWESRNVTIVVGSVARPASNASNPATCWRWRTSRKNVTPSPP